MFKPSVRYRPIEAHTSARVACRPGTSTKKTVFRYGFGGVWYMRPGTYSVCGPARGRRMMRKEQGRMAWDARRVVWKFGTDTEAREQLWMDRFAEEPTWAFNIMQFWKTYADSQAWLLREYNRGLMTMHEYINLRTMGKLADIANALMADLQAN